MDKTSSFVTGGVTLSAATIEPLVAWGMTGFHAPVPASVPLVVASLAITGLHAAYNLLRSRFAAKAADKAAPVSQQ